MTGFASHDSRDRYDRAFSAMKKKVRRGVGCLLALAIYIPAIVIMYFVTLPDEVTEDFTGKNARIFSVATFKDGENRYDYERTTLETIQGRDPELPGLEFRLPESEVVMTDHNIYHVYVLEDHGDWQLIEFNYSNTYTSKSLYRAYANRVEPISFQMTSNVGQAMMALGLIIPVYVVAWLIAFIWRRRAPQVPGDESNTP